MTTANPKEVGSWALLEKDAEVIHDLRLKLAHAEEELAAYRELMTIKKEPND